MAKKLPPLATAEEIRSLARRAIEMIDAMYGSSDDEDDEDDEEPEDHLDRHARARESARLRACIDALRLCCAAAGLLDDPSLLPVIVEALEVRENFDDHGPDDVDAMADSITWLIRAGAPIDAQVKDLARSTDSRVRLAVAKGLRAEGDASLALLEALSADPVSLVRKAAQATLAPVREVAWWRGKFSSDPALHLSDEEAMLLKPVFERIHALLDRPGYELHDREAEVAELSRALPDALAVDMARTRLAAPERWRLNFVELGADMLSREGGPAAFVQVCEAWAEADDYFGRSRGAEMLAALPPEVGARVVRELVPRVAAYPEKVRVEQTGPAGILAAAIGKGWPEGADLAPVLDTLLSLPKPPGYELDWVKTGLCDAFKEREGDATSIFARAFEARLADYPGPWKHLHTAMDALLDRAPIPAVRAAAETALQSERDEAVTWALQQILGRAYDPERDPPRLDLVRRLLADARTRSIVIDDPELGSMAAVALRDDLLARTLTLDEAQRAVAVLGGLFGGLAPSAFLVGDDEEHRAEELRAEEREKYEPFLGPEDHRVPVGDAEWDAFRALRAKDTETTGEERFEMLLTLPPGAWHPADRALLERALAAVDREEHVRVCIAQALASKPRAEDLPLFDRLLDGAEKETRELLVNLRRNARQRLGLSRSPTGGTATAKGSSEWMDEPEED